MNFFKKDFTIIEYRKLLQTIINSHYNNRLLNEHIIKPKKSNSIIIRHDVDRKPHNSLNMSYIEMEMGIVSTYYFRTTSTTFKPKIISEIVNNGHEIGYHYEDLSYCNGNFKRAIESFQINIEKLRHYYPVKSIAMHGSPLSRWDNRLLWDKYDYKDYGVVSEPYFDVDYNKTYYITDAGRTWENSKANFRDRVNSDLFLNICSTKDIRSFLTATELSPSIFLNVHPEHWTDNHLEWLTIKIRRKISNFIKGLLHKVKYS